MPNGWWKWYDGCDDCDPTEITGSGAGTGEGHCWAKVASTTGYLTINNYVSNPGDIAGWSSVNGRGGGETIRSCQQC
jgi:hypothetical protein